MVSDLHNQILNAREHLAVSKRRFEECDILVSGDIIRLRQILDPQEEDVMVINSGEAMTIMTHMHGLIEEMKTLHAKIKKIEKDIGGIKE